jgi:hypothetical protein
MPKEILPSTGSLHKEMRRGSGQPWWRYHSRQILVSPAPKLLSLNSPLWRLQAAGMVKADGAKIDSFRFLGYWKPRREFLCSEDLAD